MDVGLAAPRLVIYGLDQRAVGADRIQPTDARGVIANVLRADQPGATGHRIGLRTERQMVVGATEPIHAIVGHTRHLRVKLAHGIDVIGAALGLEPFRAKERRIADDDVGGGPSGASSIGRNQRVTDDEVGVEVIQRQGIFIDVQLVDGELVRQHHRHLGQFDGEGLDVHAVEIARGDEAEGPLRGVAAGEFADALVDARFEPLEFAVGDVEEVAAAAGRVEHAKALQPGQQFLQPLEGFCALDLLAPGFDDGRADDLHDVDGAGEMGAIRMARFLAQRMLEDGAKNFGAHLAPVGTRGILQQVQFVAGELDAGRLAEQAAVEVVDALEAAALRLARRIHLDEEPADQVVGLRAGLAFVEQTGEEILFEQADVLGEQTHQRLQGKALRGVAVYAPHHQAVENFGQQIGRLAGDFLVVVAESRR